MVPGIQDAGGGGGCQGIARSCEAGVNYLVRLVSVSPAGRQEAENDFNGFCPQRFFRAAGASPAARRVIAIVVAERSTKCRSCNGFRPRALPVMFLIVAQVAGPQSLSPRRSIPLHTLPFLVARRQRHNSFHLGHHRHSPRIAALSAVRENAVGRDRIAYHAGTLESGALEAASFDVVTFFELLEHHADPVATLTSARRLLKPGGRVRGGSDKLQRRLASCLSHLVAAAAGAAAPRALHCADLA